MKKIFIIGWKDLALVLRDRAALVLMLAAPFVLTLGLGFVSGRFSGRSNVRQAGLNDIPVVVVNHDAGQLGTALAEVFTSADLADLLAPSVAASDAEARRQVDDDLAAAAVIIPAGFSSSVIPDFNTGATTAPVAVELYANPARPVGAGVVEAIVNGFLSEVETTQVTGRVTFDQLLASGRLTPEQAAAAAAGIAGGLLDGEAAGALITLETTSDVPAAEAADDFDILAFFAPGMAMFFLMYTVTYGGRSLLAERVGGTLPRLLTTPITGAQVLGGKVFGIYLTGAAQVGVLVLASSLLFSLRWGDPLGVVALVLAVSAAATGWGLLLAAFARNPAQVGSLGSALMLLFGILGGSFVPSGNFPGWLQALSRLTPNAWGLDGFTTLARGGDLSSLALPLSALLLMAAVLFAAAVVVFRRSGLRPA
jgi:ABC-2 type transport system permease protein